MKTQRTSRWAKEKSAGTHEMMDGLSSASNAVKNGASQIVRRIHEDVRFSWHNRENVLHRQMRVAWSELPDELKAQCAKMFKIRRGLVCAWAFLAIYALVDFSRMRLAFLNPIFDLAVIGLLGVSYVICVRAAKLATDVVYAYVEILPNQTDQIIALYDRPRVTDIWAPWVRIDRSRNSFIGRMLRRLGPSGSRRGSR